MQVITKGRYRAQLAETSAEIEEAQALRHLCFHAGRAGLDCDSFDSVCNHVLIREITTNRLVCTFRFLPLSDGHSIDQSYAAQFYELSALRQFDGPMVEMGRFCIHPDDKNPDILRIAWGAMTRFVDENRIEMLFGCSSFQGTNADDYIDSFAMLKERHLAPRRWLPRVKAPQVFRFKQKLRRAPDSKRAMLQMPPLLRTYLMMGGWVSDHAVVDPHMNTLHVFTGLEIRAIPSSRQRLLRGVAQ